LAILEFRNMPKVVKKASLFELCRILGLKFSEKELAAIERSFASMEKREIGGLHCPFCSIQLFEAEDSVVEGFPGGKLYLDHLSRCKVFGQLISIHIAKNKESTETKEGFAGQKQFKPKRNP